MQWLSVIATVLLTISGFMVIGLVLIQQGKGADVGASFGGGSAGSLFGASGSANVLSRTTAISIAVFFLSALALSYVGGRGGQSGAGSVLEGAVLPKTAPAVPTNNPEAQVPGNIAPSVNQATPPAVAPAASPTNVPPASSGGNPSLPVTNSAIKEKSEKK